MENYNSGILKRLEEGQTDKTIDSINCFLFLFCFYLFFFFVKNEFHLNINQS